MFLTTSPPGGRLCRAWVGLCNAFSVGIPRLVVNPGSRLRRPWALMCIPFGEINLRRPHSAAVDPGCAFGDPGL